MEKHTSYFLSPKHFYQEKQISKCRNLKSFKSFWSKQWIMNNANCVRKWKWRKITIFLMASLLATALFGWDFWEARIPAVNAIMFTGCHQSSLCLKFFLTCFAESGLQYMKYTLILTLVQVFSLKSKPILAFFALMHHQAHAHSLSKYNRVIINSSFNSSFRIPKWWGLQNEKKKITQIF